MNIDISEFINAYDISFLLVLLISIFYGVKNGLIKSLFNLIKWILIFYLIRNCFIVLRPIVDPYITNQTISDILIFLFTLITSYIFISFINRLIIGIVQPKKSGFIDLSFGAILGILRGYIIFVLFISFVQSNVTTKIFANLLSNSSFHNVIDYGVDLLDLVPRNLEEINI